MRVVRPGEFTLPPVEAVASLSRPALLGALTALAGLTLAIGAALASPSSDGGFDPNDAMPKLEAIAALHLKSDRWLRSTVGKKLRSRRIGGEWMFSRRKIAAFLAGEPLP
jgi:hypothetical protein